MSQHTHLSEGATVTAVACPACGVAVQASELFCRDCGRTLPSRSLEQPAATAPALAARPAATSAAWLQSAAAIYLENAFRVLALPVDATERDVRIRARERAMQLELGGADRDAVLRV